MARKNRFGGCLNSFEAQLIRRKAKQFAEADRDDIEQELALQLWRQHPKYDAARSSPQTFATRVVGSKAANLAAARKAAKRSAPLESLSKRGDAIPGEVVDPSDFRAASRRDSDDLALKHDVARLVAKLPADLQALCVALAAGTVSDAAKELGISRPGLYDRLGKLRPQFERAGLKRYLRSDTLEVAPVGTSERKRSRRRE